MKKKYPIGFATLCLLTAAALWAAASYKFPGDVILDANTDPSPSLMLQDTLDQPWRIRANPTAGTSFLRIVANVATDTAVFFENIGAGITDIEVDGSIHSGVSIHAEDTTSADTTIQVNDEGEFRALEEAGNGINYKGFKSPAAVTANTICTFENDSSFIPDSCVGDGTDAGGTIPPREYYFPAAALQNLEHVADEVASIEKSTGTNVDVYARNYSASVDQCAGGSLGVPSNLDTSGTVTFRLKGYHPSGGCGASNCTVRMEIRAIDRDGGETWDSALSAESVDVESSNTINVITEVTWTETVSNLGWDASDTVLFELCRDANHGNDDLATGYYIIDFLVEIPRA